MDLRGIEPLSESLSLKASPITVADLTFPQQYAHRQAYCFSSFMIHLPGQSLPGKVSHIVDARFPMCECNGADEQLRLLTLTFRLRLYLVPGWYAVQESADGFPNFKAPVETSTSPQTNFLVSFLTGFNYTRMIFCVKVISKNGHKKTRISGFFHHKQIFIIRIRYLFIANQLLRSLFVIHGRDTLLFLCQFSACRPGLQTEEPEPVHLFQQLPVW